MNERMVGRIDRSTDRLTDGWTEEQTDGETDEQTNGRTDGDRMNEVSCDL